ncbi:MAG: DUF349 domain-containing protein [Vicinamibacterales bacterium]
MSFLDRFKIQPKHKSPDPEVRFAYVHELPAGPLNEEDAAAVVALAREDSEARVRRAAVARIDDVGVLAAITGSEVEGSIREDVQARLATIAASGDSADAAGRALAALTDQKQIAAAAKTSPFEAVRVDAVARLTDTKSLGSVARNAADARTAALAAERISDQAELLNVATRTDHKDAGIAALERAAANAALDRTALEALSERAKNKSVAKRARAMVQAMDEAETARRQALEQHQQRVAGAIARAEALAASPTPAAAPQIDDAEAAWQDLTTTATHDITAADRGRFDSAVRAARAVLEREARERAEQAQRDAQLAESRNVREALCARVDSIQGEDALDRLEESRSEWEGLPPDPDRGVHEQLARRFAEGCARAKNRHDNRQESARMNVRLEDLSREAEQLAAQEDSPAYAWDSISREWKSLHEKTEGLDEAALQRYSAAETAIRERAEAKKAAAEKALRQQVQRIDQLIERAHKRAEAEDLTLKEADKAAKDLRTAIEIPLTLPHHEREYLVERLKAALAALAPKLHELREMDEWKRFANAAVQEELIAQAEALGKKYDLEKPDDMEKAARELHDIQERWKQAAEAPRAQAQTLWHRYRQAADPVQAKARDFFAARGAEREANLKVKLDLVTRAEALAESTDWIKTAEEMKKLQAEWQASGPVPRPDTRVVWKRFRDACDKFFSRRNEDLAQRKEVWATNQGRKEALCARAEELAESREWDKASAELRRLQAEWKTIGPVRRTKSEALWQRFRGAADRFFDRYKRRDEIEIEARQADREALAVELESFLPVEGAEAVAPPELLEKVRSLRTRWNQSTTAVRQGADPLSARFMSGMERVLTTYPEAFKGSELDVDASRQRMEKLVSRLESFVSENESKSESSQDLAARLREALASNTIGGRAGDENKWRGMADEVRQAQSAFSRLVPVPGDAGQQLADRFHKACNRFFDQYRKKVPQQSAPPPRSGRPVGTR